jgi:hypothetical protein
MGVKYYARGGKKLELIGYSDNGMAGDKVDRKSNLSYPVPRKEGTKPPYVCPGSSNHTHGNNMINR